MNSQGYNDAGGAGSVGGLDAAASQNMDLDPYNYEDINKLAEFYYSLMPKNGQICKPLFSLMFTLSVISSFKQ